MEGMYFGWDDPRTWSLQALKRRGFLPEAIRNFVLSFGLHQNEITVPVDTLYAENRKLIDPTAPRYFFVEDPVELKVTGAPEQRLAINLHPEQPAMGSREIKTGDTFYIIKADMGSFKAGKLQRLMDCLNFTKKGRGFVFDSLDHETFRKKGEKIIHWVAGSGHVDAEVLMPDASVVKGYAENALSQVKPGTVVQLQRFGFCRLDRKEGNKLVFWFSHK
jgi:glutamyl-tRNA synthetase